MSLIRFGLKKTRFGSDIIVIYCNSQVVNSQQIFQRYSITAMSNELFVPNSVSVYSFETFFICTLIASKVTFVPFSFELRIACSFFRKIVLTDVTFLDCLDF